MGWGLGLGLRLGLGLGLGLGVGFRIRVYLHDDHVRSRRKELARAPQEEVGLDAVLLEDARLHADGGHRGREHVVRTPPPRVWHRALQRWREGATPGACAAAQQPQRKLRQAADAAAGRPPSRIRTGRADTSGLHRMELLDHAAVQLRLECWVCDDHTVAVARSRRIGQRQNRQAGARHLEQGRALRRVGSSDRAGRSRRVGESRAFDPCSLQIGKQSDISEALARFLDFAQFASRCA